MTILLAIAASSQALGVYEVDLKSGLHQKLDVNIPIKTDTINELEGLTIIVSPKYMYGFSDQRLYHKIVRSDSGDFLHIASSKVIKEPLFSFKLEIVSQQTRLIRDYELIMDIKDK